MKYRSVTEAKDLPGLRLVLTAHMPGPWGEAAKFILSARNVEFVPVEQRAMEKNEDLFAWTGMRNAPIAVYDDEPPQSTWLEILLLAERLGSGASLIPEDPIERALMMGFSTEICSPDGFAWSRRLELMGRSNVRNPSSGGNYDMTRMTLSYGVTPETIARAPKRMISIMQGLARQLRAQRAGGSDYLVGKQLSACDLHWAAFSGFVAPLPPELCPMPDFMRHNYTHLTPELAEALDPILLEHRDLVYQRHVTLPMDFSSMIDLYYAPTPNTWKASIMLEECGLPYRVVEIDIMAGDQKQPEFFAINPNGRIPAIVDHDAPDGPLPVFESGAILIYLAEKTGRFLAPAGRARAEALGWLMWQMGGLGPIAGQAHHFRRYAPPGNEYSEDRFVAETSRLYGVLESHLKSHEWLAGGAYGIADIASWGWVWYHRMHGQDLADLPQVARWFYAVSDRPAVQRGRMVGVENQSEENRARLIGPYYGANGPAPGAS